MAGDFLQRLVQRSRAEPAALRPRHNAFFAAAPTIDLATTDDAQATHSSPDDAIQPISATQPGHAEPSDRVLPRPLNKPAIRSARIEASASSERMKADDAHGRSSMQAVPLPASQPARATQRNMTADVARATPAAGHPATGASQMDALPVQQGREPAIGPAPAAATLVRTASPRPQVVERLSPTRTDAVEPELAPIKISIDRVEIKAPSPPRAAPPAQRPESALMSLSDYLGAPPGRRR